MVGKQYWAERVRLFMVEPSGALYVSDSMDRWLAEWLLVNVVSPTAQYNGVDVVSAKIVSMAERTPLNDVSVPVR